MKLAIQSFFGVAPKIAPRYLPDGAAQVAVNVEAFGQSLKPLLGPLAASPAKQFATNTSTIYKFGQNTLEEDKFWLTWDLDHDVVRSQITGAGTREWTFWTGGDNPRATYDTLAQLTPPGHIRLGLPAPVSPLTGTVGDPAYCEVDGERVGEAAQTGFCTINGVRDATKTTQAACESASGIWTPQCTTLGSCKIAGVVNNTYKTQATCVAASGVWTPGVWITGAKLSPAKVTLTPDILSQVNSIFGLELSTNNGTDYRKVLPSGGGAPSLWITQAHLNLMSPDYGLRVSVDNERTWAVGTLSSLITQEADFTLSAGEIAAFPYQPTVTVTVTGGTINGSISLVGSNLSSADAVVHWFNTTAGSPVTATKAGSGVQVRSKGVGSGLVMTVAWAANAYRTANGSSLVQAQDNFMAAIAAAKINGTALARVSRTATDQLTVTSATAGADVTLVVRWGPSDGDKLVAVGTAADTSGLVAAINALGITATYTGATAAQDGDDVIVTSTATGKDAKLRIRWGDGTTQYRSATGVTSDLGTLETRVYTYTWVLKEADMEWESAPYSADTMPSFDVYPDGSVTLTGFEVGPTITANGWGPTAAGTLHQRLYRSVNGVYLFVAEWAVNRTSTVSTTYTDTLDADQLGEELPSTTWTKPAYQMVGLINMPNGMIAGFHGREVYFCEPYRPYAWPDIYSQSVDYPIVGLGRMDTTLAVLTTGVPYFIQGSSPDMLVMVKSDLEQACVAKRSIVSLGGAVFYASPDGLMMLSSGGSDILTRDLMDRDDWQALKPTTIHAYGHDNQYIAFHDAVTDEYGNVTYGFIIDLKSKQFVRHSVQAVAGFNDLRGDTLYLVAADGQLVKWGEGAARVGKWRSKIFSQPQMNAFACAQVEAGPFLARDPYPLTVRVYADRKLFYAYTILPQEYQDPSAVKILSRRNPFRLPTLNREHCTDSTQTTQAACEAAGSVWNKGFHGRDWEIELDVEQEIFNVALAQSPAEIATT